jgi:hypothetical protein
VAAAAEPWLAVAASSAISRSACLRRPAARAARWRAAFSGSLLKPIAHPFGTPPPRPHRLCIPGRVVASSTCCSLVVGVVPFRPFRLVKSPLRSTPLILESDPKAIGSHSDRPEIYHPTRGSKPIPSRGRSTAGAYSMRPTATKSRPSTTKPALSCVDEGPGYPEGATPEAGPAGRALHGSRRSVSQIARPPTSAFASVVTNCMPTLKASTRLVGAACRNM